MWQRGLLNLINFEGWIHRDCLILWSFDVFFFWIHRNLVSLLNPDVSGIYGFMHIHRNSAIYSNPDVFQLISRDCTCFPPQNTPAQAGINPAGYIGICHSRGAPMYLLQITTQPPNVLPPTLSASYTSPRTA